MSAVDKAGQALGLGDRVVVEDAPGVAGGETGTVIEIGRAGFAGGGWPIVVGFAPALIEPGTEGCVHATHVADHQVRRTLRAELVEALAAALGPPGKRALWGYFACDACGFETDHWRQICHCGHRGSTRVDTPPVGRDLQRGAA